MALDDVLWQIGWINMNKIASSVRHGTLTRIKTVAIHERSEHRQSSTLINPLFLTIFIYLLPIDLSGWMKQKSLRESRFVDSAVMPPLFGFQAYSRRTPMRASVMYILLRTGMGFDVIRSWRFAENWMKRKVFSPFSPFLPIKFSAGPRGEESKKIWADGNLIMLWKTFPRCDLYRWNRINIPGVYDGTRPWINFLKKAAMNMLSVDGCHEFFRASIYIGWVVITRDCSSCHVE